MKTRTMDMYNASRQAGLSLIELMIALVLSVLLILGIVEIFGSTRAAFGASEGLARAQENGRFAMDFFRRDVRMAGHLGCLNEFSHIGGPEPLFYNHFIGSAAALTTAPLTLRMDLPVEVYDFTGSVPGSSYAIPNGVPVPATAGSAWTPALPTDLGVINAGAGGALRGSDVIVVRYFEETPITLAGGAALGQGGVNQTTGTVWTGAATSTIQSNAVYGLTNCRVASLFQVTSVNVGSGTLGSTGGQNVARPTGAFWDAKEVYGVGSLMFRYRAVVYYVGLGASGSPSLFRRSLTEVPPNAGAGVAFAPSEEVVEGVELMQVLLATSAVPTTTRVDDVTAYQSSTALLSGAATPAAVMTALRRVAGLRVSILQRSPNAIPGGTPASPTIVVGDITVTPPVDRRIRQVYDNLIMLRNRQRA